MGKEIWPERWERAHETLVGSPSDEPGRRNIVLGPLSLAVPSAHSREQAEEPAGEATAPVAVTPGWTEFLDGLRDIPSRILARLPPDPRDDPLIR